MKDRNVTNQSPSYTDFLRAKGLPVPEWMARKPAKLPEVYQD